MRFSSLYALLFVGCLIFSDELLAQSCNPATPGTITGGLSIPPGGNGDICANNAVIPASMRIEAGNVDDGDNPGNVQFLIDWDDGTTETITLTAADWGGAGSHNYLRVVTHLFPVTGGDVACTYSPSVRLVVAGNVCGSLGVPPTYVRWNTDNENSGQLSLVDLAGNNVIEVCQGTATGVVLRDASTLNCTANTNTGQRWRRFVYGTAGSNIADVLVGGNPVVANHISAGMPFSQMGPTTAPLNDTDGTTPETGQNSLVITIPPTATVGQRYFVRMDYWNQCNPFDLGEDPVSTFAEIVVVNQPTPPTGSNQTVCKGTTPNAFSVTGVPAGATVNFYRNINGVPDVTPIQSSTSTTLAINNYDPSATDSLQMNVAGYYKVWASYTPNVFGATNCETVKVPCTIIIRQEIPAPGEINGPTEVCADGTTVYLFDITNDSPVLTPIDPPTPASQFTNVGGATHYNWSWNNASNIVNAPGAGGTTFKEFSVRFNTGIFGPGISTTRTLRATSSYTSGMGCASDQETDVITIFKVSQGGIISPATGDICSGGSKDFELTGFTGSVVQWEYSKDGGPWTPDADFGTLSNPAAKVFTTTGSAPETYTYRAVVKNGACSEVYSASASFTVYPVPAKPSVNVSPDPAVICSDGSNVTLTSDDGGGIGTIYRWYKLPDQTSPVQIGASNQLVLNTVAQSGDYIVELLGPTPLSCGSQLSDPITVTIHPLPEVINVSGGGATCDGNPAPDITFEFSDPGLTFEITDPSGDIISVTAHPSTTYVLSGAALTEAGDFRITYLYNPVTGCEGTSLGGVATVSSAGGAPTFDEPRAFTPADACDDGSSTVNPTLDFSLLISLAGDFKLTYQIDALAPRTINFTVDANGDPTTPIEFTDTELDVVGLHTVTLISIETPAGCFATFNEPFTFEVYERPSVATGAVDGIACSSPGTGAALRVDNPGPNHEIVWSTGGPSLASFVNAVPGAGSVSGSANEIFTPNTSATATFYAFVRNTNTTCLSATGLAVTQIEDEEPTTSNAGPDQDNCTGTFTLAGNIPDVTNGEIGTWSVPGILYQQSFTGYANGTQTSAAVNGWNIDLSDPDALSGGSGHFSVQGGQFSANNTDGGASGGAELVWRSPVITGAFTNVNISIDLSSSGVMEPSDYLTVSYILDGNPEVPLVNGNQNGDIITPTATATGLSGTSLQLVVRANNNAADEFYRFDNILIAENDAPVLSDPNVFNASISGIPEGATRTLTWSISSRYGECSPATSTVNLTRNPLPVITTNVTPTLCEDISGANFANDINLNAYSSDITGLPGPYTTGGSLNIFESASDDIRIEWFTNSARTLDVADASNVDGITDGTKLYCIVSFISTGCSVNGEITFTVESLPTANDQDYFFCPDAPPGNGTASTTATIDLTTIALTDIYGSDPPAERIVSYHNSLAEAEGGLNPITGDVTVTSTAPSLSVFARVENTLNGCVNTSEITLNFQNPPVNNQIRDALNNLLVDGLSGTAPFIGSRSLCASGSLVLFQINPGANPGATYTWSIPAPSYTVPAGDPDNPGSTPQPEFEVLSGLNNYFVILKFPYSTTAPPGGRTSNFAGGIPITVTETLGGVCNGNPLTLMVNVDASPPQPVVSGPLEVCENGTATYTITSGAGVNNTWTIPPGATITNSPTGSSINVQMGIFDGQISVTASSGTGCVSPPSTPLGIDVIPRPSFTFTPSPALCSGENISTALTLTPSIAAPFDPADVRFDWQVINVAGAITNVNVGDNASGVTAINQVPINTSGIPGTIIYRVTPIGVGPTSCAGNPQNISVTVNPEPVLALTDKTLCSGEAADYEIKMTPLTLPSNTMFSWAAPVMSDGSAQGSANSVLSGIAGTIHINTTFVNTTAGSITATYTISAVSAQGCASSQSVADRQIVFTINPEPVGTDITRAAQCSDVPFSVSSQNVVNGLDATSTYTWVRNPLPTGLTLISAGTGNGSISETLQNLTGGTLNVTYTVTPRSALGCDGASYNVTVPINPEPVGVPLTHPAQCSDVPFVLSPQSISNGLGPTSTYTWVRNPLPAGLVFVASGSGVGDIDETLQNLTSVTLNATYTVTPRSADGCDGNPYIITIPVNPEPVGAAMTHIPQCSDVAFSLSPQNITNGLGGTSTYTWVRNTLPAGLTASTPGTGSGLITETLQNLSGVQLTATYVVTPRSASGCDGDPYVVSIPVEPEPVGADITLSEQCSGVGFNVSAANITNGLGATSTYTWVRNLLPTGLTLIAAGTGTGNIAETLQNLTGGTLNVSYTITPRSATGCNGDPYVITIPINPEPVGLSATRAAQCSNAAFSLSAENITNGLGGTSSFTWTRNSLPAGLTVIVPGTGNGPIAETLQNLTGAPLNAVYTVVPRSAQGCDGDSYQITIPINPEPVGMDITRAQQCSDVPFNVSADNITNGIGATSTFTWIRNPLPGGLTLITPGTNTGNIAERLENLTGTQLSVSYTVTPRSAANCEGSSYVVTVPINPEPVGADIIRSAQCSDVSFSVSADNIINFSGTTSSFTWVRNPLPAGITVTVSGTGTGNIAETLQNLTNAQLNATYTVTPTSALGCTGSTYVVTVPVNPEPVAPSLTSIERCSGENINFDLQTIVDAVGGNALPSQFTFTVTASSLSGLSPLIFPGVFDRTTPSSAIINQVFTNLSNAPITITYTVTPWSDGAGCEGSPFELQVVLYPQPVGIDFSDPVCSSSLNHDIQAKQINVLGGNSLPSVFTYTVSSNDEVAVPTPPALDRTVASNLPITDSFTNASGGDVIVTYTITPFRQGTPGCQGAPIVYQLVISSKPVGFDFTADPVCSNAPFDIDPQDIINDLANGGNGVTSTFTWTANYGTPGNLTVNGAAPPSTDTDLDGHVNGFLTNKTDGQKVAVYTVTPRSGTCVGNTFEIRVPVNPQPVLDPSVIHTPICSDTPFDFDLASIAGTVTHTSYDVTLVSVHPDLVASPLNRFSLPTTAFRPGEPETSIRNETYSNTSRTIGLMVEYAVTANSEITPGLVCQGESLQVRIEILPEPVMNPALGTLTVCSDVASDIQLDTDGISISADAFFVNSITLQSDGSAISPGATTGAVTAKNSNAFADADPATGARDKMYIRNDAFTVIDNVSASQRTVVYNVTPKTAAGCFGDPFDINLQVLPEPEFDYIVPPPVCSDASIALELHRRTSPPAGTNSVGIARYDITGITWQSGLQPGGSNISIGQSLIPDVNGNFIAIDDSYTNGTAGSLNASYFIKPVAITAFGHACEGDPVNAVVTIKPSPVVLGNLDKIVCNDAVNGITIGTEFASAVAQSYEIIRNPLPGDLSPGTYSPGTVIINGATTNNISGDRLINSANNPVAYTYTVRANTDPDGTGCFGPAETITVTVEPQILASVTGVNQICSGTSTLVELSSLSTPSAGEVTFNFTASSAVPGAISGMAPGTNFNAGQDIEQLLSNSSNNPVNVTYTITPRANSAAGGGICIGPQSTFVVSVEPKPRLTMTPASLTVCEGVPLGVDFSSVTVPSTGAPSLFFQLETVEDPNTLAAPANVSGFVTTYPTNYTTGTDALNDVLVNSATDQQTLRYVFTPSFVIPSGETCTGDQVSLNVTVSPRPTLLPFTVDPKCSGEAFSIDYSSFVTEADHASTLATWTYAYTPAGDPDLTGASNGAGFELSQVVFNKNPDPATVTYSIKARSFTCESNTIQVPVQIYPTPRVTGTPNSVNVCNGGMLSIPFNSTASNTLYTWIVDDESQPTLTGASDQPTPIAGPMSFTLNNTSTVLSNYTFEITPQVNTSLAGKVCLGDPFTLVANVAPPLNGRITTSNGTNESFICAGSREFLFLEFDGLPLFDVVYKEGTNINILTKQGAFKPIQVTPMTTTVYELVSIKDAFGCTLNINQTATVNVNNTDASFSVLGPPEACSPYKVSFQYDQQADVNYTWKWFDGPDSTMYTATTSELAKIVKHTFENPSPVGVAKFKVYLETSLADPRYPGCTKTSFQEVRVSPNIGLGVFPNATEICSGETVSFTNSSQGVSSHRWFYREQGTTQENDVRTAVSPSFQLVNNTTQNPIVYEVVYNADNGSCPTSSVIPITVYRNVDAAFDEGTIPPYIGGSSIVTFTNNSKPLDPSEFSYQWTFGGNATPETFAGANTTIPVTYTLPGLKEVTLTVTNTVANANGLTCSDVFSKTIEILLPPLIASFNATPLAGCFPIDITITENMSTGDIYKWQVIDQSGNIAATAIAPNPIFRISNPGTYDIFLETSSSVTGQTAFAQKTGIEVFDRPLASIEARPTTLFVPDTELITFNFSTGANFYQWDFDDGTVSDEYEPKHFYQLEGTYQITLVAGYDHGDRDIDGDGVPDGNVICYDTAKRDIIARQGGLTKIPNAFTPNPNGPSNGGDPGSGTFNDVFLPITKGVAKEDGAFIMQIYDRWGTLMFESRNQNQGWDGYDRNGNLVPAGVYVYKLDLRLVDGQRITQVGDVTVIR